MIFHQLVAKALREHGVEVLFGVLGDANLFCADAFVRSCGGQFVSTAHEAGAVLAANGYARTTEKLGVATVTHGPALTNSMTAMVESVRDRTPLLVVAGDTPVADRWNLQHIPQRDVVRSAGAGFVQVRTPDTIHEDLDTAVRRAHAERRPVVLNVPAEFQWSESASVRSTTQSRPIVRSGTPATEAMDIAAGIVASSNRPVVLAGRGATRPDAREALLRLADRIGAPVATTLRARDLFRSHPHEVGIFGTLTDEAGLEVLQASDCVIAVGASLNEWTTANGSLLEGRAVVQVDTDATALGAYRPVDAPVVGDAASFADAMVEFLDLADVPASAFASPEMASRLAALRHGGPGSSGDATADMDLAAAMHRIEAAFPRDRALVIDAGRFIFTALQVFRVPEPGRYVHTANFGSIGLGMGNAIGAAIGTGRPVLHVTGDGGFMMGGIAEFNTAVRHGLDIVVIVVNDGAYGAEHVQFRRREMDPSIATFAWPDLADVARSLGGGGHSVEDLDGLDRALGALPGRKGPVLIDLRVDPDSVGTAGH